MSTWSLVGNTPTVRLRSGDGELLVKLETYNLTGSLKDRVALNILKRLMGGSLAPGDTVELAEGGPLAISMAALAAPHGIGVAAPPSGNRHLDRLAEAYGVRPVGPGDGRAASRLDPDTVFEVAVETHYEWTGGELLRQAGAVDAVVAGVISGATLVGIGKRVREVLHDALVIGVQLEECPMPSDGRCAVPWAPVPRPSQRRLELLDKIVDDYVTINVKEALEGTRLASRSLGVLVGPSGGANVAGALKAMRAYGLRRVATIIPDRGETFLEIIT